MDTIEHPLHTGIETLGLRCEVTRPDDRALEDLERNFGRALTTYRPDVLPPGLSFLSIAHTPQGWFANLEGNLTTLLHGPGSEVGSLSAGELPLATKALVDQARHLVPGVLPYEPWHYDVTRFDPSTTLLLAEGFDTAETIDHVHWSWANLRSGKQVVTRHDSGALTATYRLKSNRSRSIYDKSRQAAREGKACPPRAVRLEARIRPTTKKALSELGAVMTESSEELRAIAAAMPAVVQANTQVMVRTFIEAQKALGEKVNATEAYLMASVYETLKGTGDITRLTDDGFSRASAYRYRARLNVLLDAADESVQTRAAESVFGPHEVLLARQMADEIIEATEERT